MQETRVILHFPAILHRNAISLIQCALVPLSVFPRVKCAIEIRESLLFPSKPTRGDFPNISLKPFLPSPWHIPYRLSRQLEAVFIIYFLCRSPWWLQWWWWWWWYEITRWVLSSLDNFLLFLSDFLIKFVDVFVHICMINFHDKAIFLSQYFPYVPFTFTLLYLLKKKKKNLNVNELSILLLNFLLCHHFNF